MASAGPSANHQAARRCTWQATACWIWRRLRQHMAEQQWTLERRTQANDSKRYRRTWRADRSAQEPPCVPRWGPQVGRAASAAGRISEKEYITTRHNTKRSEERAGPSLSRIPAETSTTITYYKYCNANTYHSQLNTLRSAIHNLLFTLTRLSGGPATVTLTRERSRLRCTFDTTSDSELKSTVCVIV